jgi:hypothetical protein
VKITWNLNELVALCKAVEAVCVPAGCHVAMTGGCLYKDGERKDADLLFYRVRQVKDVDKERLFALLSEIGIEEKSGFGWCHKAEYQGKPLDLFFPEEDGDGSEYTTQEKQDETNTAETLAK